MQKACLLEEASPTLATANGRGMMATIADELAEFLVRHLLLRRQIPGVIPCMRLKERLNPD